MSYPNTPIQFTSRIYQGNANNYTLYGMALLDGGLCQVAQTNGIGLVTFGFVWQGPEIWFFPQEAQSLTTGWTAAAGYTGSGSAITTSWMAASGYAGSSLVITTTWTNSTEFGVEFLI